MPITEKIIALNLPLKETPEHAPDIRAALEYLEKEHGLVPHDVRASSGLREPANDVE